MKNGTRTPKSIEPLSQSAQAAFWSCATTHLPGCWLWKGAIRSNGYGRWGNHYAHRVAYVIANGSIPEGMTIDHTCGVRSCVYPLHLQAVSASENRKRGIAKPAASKHPADSHPRRSDRFRDLFSRGLCVQCAKPSKTYRCLDCRERHNSKDKDRVR